MALAMHAVVYDVAALPVRIKQCGVMRLFMRSGRLQTNLHST